MDIPGPLPQPGDGPGLAALGQRMSGAHAAMAESLAGIAARLQAAEQMAMQGSRAYALAERLLEQTKASNMAAESALPVLKELMVSVADINQRLLALEGTTGKLAVIARNLTLDLAEMRKPAAPPKAPAEAAPKAQGKKATGYAKLKQQIASLDEGE